jgi:potassium-transporting ATPase KdpC subunit
MRTLIRPAFASLVVLTLLTGVVYPLVVTLVSALVFPRQAQGSLLEVKGKVVGSELIGQGFAAPKYFWSRPSATGPQGYNAASSSGSNLGPSNPALADAVRDRVAALHAADPESKAPVPIDLVTASASGLDPHISVAAAEYQVRRVARARGLPTDSVESLVQRSIEGRQFGLFGEPRVNVLRLNLALDGLPRAP